MPKDKTDKESKHVDAMAESTRRVLEAEKADRAAGKPHRPK